MTVALFPLGEGGRGIGFLFAKLPKNMDQEEKLGGGIN